MDSRKSNISNIGVGTKLSVNEATTAIYEKYESYFEVETTDIYEEYKSYLKDDSICDCFKIYVLKKEPSPELAAELKAYYDKIAEKNQKVKKYIDKIAKDVFDHLDDEAKKYIFDHPDSTEHHMGMGMGIRNQYDLWKEQPSFLEGIHPDDLSASIVERVASYVIPNYDFDNPYYRSLYGDFTFNHLRRLFHAFYGYYPDKIIEKYENETDDGSASKRARKEVRNAVINKARFKTMCKKYGISDKNRDDLIRYVDQYNKKNWDVIPYDIGLLGSSSLDDDLRQQCLRLLKAVLDQHSQHAEDLPVFLFHQKDAVLIMVGKRGKALKRVKRFNADDEVIRKALTENGEAIQYVSKELRDKIDYIRLALSNEYSSALKMRCMIKYRDDEKIVRIALKANGRNIQYASDRLKDDMETAKYAVTHQKHWYPESTVCNLSRRLRDSEEIAFLDIRKGNASVDAYSDRLRDSDDIAKALLKTKNRFKIHMMSERICKKYIEGWD